MSLHKLFKYASDLQWHAMPCPLCQHRNDMAKAEMRRKNAPNTFNLPSLDGEDIEWQCDNCKAWNGHEDEP